MSVARLLQWVEDADHVPTQLEIFMMDQSIAQMDEDTAAESLWLLDEIRERKLEQASLVGMMLALRSGPGERN